MKKLTKNQESTTKKMIKTLKEMSKKETKKQEVKKQEVKEIKAPKELKIKGVNYKKIEINHVQDLRELIVEDAELLTAIPTDLEDYEETYEVGKNFVEKIKNNLDILDIIIVLESKSQFITVSKYTEAVMIIDFEEMQPNIDFYIYKEVLKK